MNERLPYSNEPSFELPTEVEGWERKSEKAIENPAGTDQPTLTSQTPVLDDDAQIPVDDSTPAAELNMQTAAEVGHENEVDDKQWTNKTKAITVQYKDNPHRQKQEFTKLQAAYMKARFNKVIKVEEAA